MSEESIASLIFGRSTALQVDDEKGDSQDPLKTLMTAVLIRAIEDFHGSGQLRRDAARYLFHADRKSPEDYLFSLSSICECLQLDISNLRRKILTLQNRLKIRRRVA